MFCKYTKEIFPFKTYVILPTSTIPTTVSILDHCMFQLLQQIVLLIKQKYALHSHSNYECVYARFDNSSGYQSASILFLNNFHSEKIECMEQQNKWPIELLKHYNGVLSKENHPTCGHKCFSVVALPTADLVRIKECIERLSQPEIVEDYSNKTWG